MRRRGEHFCRKVQIQLRTQSNVAELDPVDPSLKTRQRIYTLPRSAAEVRINDYNPLILYLWKANVDIQYVAESSLALAGYVTAYVNKAEKSNLQDVWSDIAISGNIYSQLWLSVITGLDHWTGLDYWTEL